MDNEKIGKFICELRKSGQMTQKELADRLNITDKAVSKWERGLSYPDISLLPPLADSLGVTVSELLSGERISADREVADTIETIETSVDNALKYGDSSAKNRLKAVRRIISFAFTVLMLLGASVCVICNLAIDGGMTWSWIPVSSIVFAWLTLIPIVKFEKNGVKGSLSALSILIIPYLCALGLMIQAPNVYFLIAILVSVISIMYLWCIYWAFRKFAKRKLLALAVIMLAAIPVDLFINLSLAVAISEPMLEVGDVIGLFATFILAVVIIFVDVRIYKNNHTRMA